MRCGPARLALAVAVIASVAVGLPVPCTGSVAPEAEEALLKIEAALGMSKLSKELWPGWDVSDTPVALVDSAGECYLIEHPDPPAGFERVKGRSPVKASIYHGRAGIPEAREPSLLGGAPTAFVELEGFAEDALPLAFEAAFRAHVAEVCSDRATPVDLLVGYPVDAENLAMADIECRLLRRAALAPDDSLAQYVREFASVRAHRRIRMGGRFTEYERSIEFREGVPRYVGECCRRESESHMKGKRGERLRDAVGEPRPLEECLVPTHSLEWYRHTRFAWTGALICQLMDRISSRWREDAARECVDPFELMYRQVKRTTPRATRVLSRFGYEELVSEKAAGLEAAKSPAERLFESIARSGQPLFAVSTHLLSSGEVSFDPTGIEKVDAHREVHTRLIKIVYSGGTHVHLLGRPTAVVLGDDEFDFRQLITAAPEEYSITIDGRELSIEEGVYEFTRSLRVEAQGMSIEAQAGSVMIGESGISFVLHR